MALMQHWADCAKHQRRSISSTPQLTCDALKECHLYRSSGQESWNCHIVELNGVRSAEVCGGRGGCLLKCSGYVEQVLVFGKRAFKKNWMIGWQ